MCAFAGVADAYGTVGGGEGLVADVADGEVLEVVAEEGVFAGRKGWWEEDRHCCCYG